MTRRILTVALALCVIGWGLRAAERATFILTDGQRVSGMLDTRELSGSQLSLVVTPGLAGQTFSYDQVAVIDFAGGWPRANELAALPEDGHMMMAMRGGGTRVGYLITTMNGDTVVWQDEGGGRRNVPVRQIARVYVDADSARSIFSAPRQARAPGGFQVVVSNLSVPGDAPWTNARIDVIRGDVLRFDDQGGITFIEGPNNTANAGGKPEMKSDTYPVPSAGVGALIGKVGVNGTPFYIGAGAHPVTMPATGRLYLGVNDDHFADNTGAFSVTILRR